jgi:fructokinase
MAGEPSPSGVLVTGATTADFYFEESADGTVGAGMHWIPGGIGTSVARSMALFGDSPLLATRLGDDSFAKAIDRELDVHDIPRTLVTETRDDTPLLFYVPADAGGPHWETRIEGSSFGFDIPDWSESLFADLSVVHLTGTTLPPEIGLDAMRTAVEYAGAHDVDVSFDMNCRPNQWSDLSKYTDLAAELLAAADLVFASTDDLALAGFDEGIDGLLSALPERDSALGFLTEGGDGATAVRIDEGSVTARYTHPGFDVEVVDPAAGGDAFASAVLAAVENGVTDIETLVEIGNAAGAAAVTSMGPLRDGDIEFLRSHSDWWPFE